MDPDDGVTQWCGIGGDHVALVVEVQRRLKELTFVSCTWPCASAADRSPLESGVLSCSCTHRAKKRLP